MSSFSSHKLLPQCHALALRVGVPVLPGLWVKAACPSSLHTLPDIPQPLIILGLLHNAFPCPNTPPQRSELPPNTMFQEQLPGTQVTARLCSCPRDHSVPPWCGTQGMHKLCLSPPKPPKAFFPKQAFPQKTRAP